MSSKPGVLDFLEVSNRLFTREDLDFMFDAIDDWEMMPGLLQMAQHVPIMSESYAKERLRIELSDRVKREEAVKEIRDRKKKGAIIKTKLIYLMDVKKTAMKEGNQDGKGNVAPAEDGRAYQEIH